MSIHTYNIEHNSYCLYLMCIHW